MKHKPYGPYEKYFKRLIDLCCGLAALSMFWWLFAVVAILVRVKLGSPVLFSQDRPGKDEKVFKLYKFRTMTDARDKNGNLLPDNVRLTTFGKLLRSTSLDELPEVINIIKGDMSVIGPRPLMQRYLNYYNAEEKRRHEVRPGLSGYAQVHGRNNVDWGERLKLDVYYVDHISFLMDMRILLDTLLLVVKREGVSSENMMNFDTYRIKQWKSSVDQDEGI